MFTSTIHAFLWLLCGIPTTIIVQKDVFAITADLQKWQKNIVNMLDTYL